MTTRSVHSIAERLNASRLAVQNSLSDPEVLALVSAYGFTADKLNAGGALYAAALKAVDARQAAAGAQQDATASLQKAEAAAREAYQSLAKTARAVVDRGGLIRMGLSGIEPHATAAFLAAAYTLFDNAVALPILKEFGFDAARLAAGRSQVAAYDQANQKQEAAKGAAQQATRDQEAALEAMEAWTAQYLKIARVALHERPQLLEKLGVTARTGRTAAQIAGRKKAAAARLAPKEE